jgi:hypothetical protein
MFHIGPENPTSLSFGALIGLDALNLQGLEILVFSSAEKICIFLSDCYLGLRANSISPLPFANAYGD